MEHYVTTLNDLKERKIMQVEVMYRTLLLIMTEEGIYAVQDKCPHRGISLSNGTIEGNTIKCKDHGLPISLKTGEVTSERQANYLRLSKDSRSIPTYPVTIKDDKVFIIL